MTDDRTADPLTTPVPRELLSEQGPTGVFKMTVTNGQKVEPIGECVDCQGHPSAEAAMEAYETWQTGQA